MTVVKKSANHQGSVRCIRKVYQLIERYGGHGRDVRGLGEV